MNNHCGSCKAPATTNLGHLGPLCKGCFAQILRKRVRKAIKDFGWRTQGQTIFYEEKTAQNKAAIMLFKDATPGLKLELVSADKAEVIMVSKTADDEVENFMNQLFEGKLDPVKKCLNVLANVSTEEIQKYCELKNIDGEIPQKSELRGHLETLENRYRGTIFSLQKSRKSFE